MKFSEMPYARPDLNEMKQQLQALTDRDLEAAKAAPAMTTVVATFSMVAESMVASWRGGVVVPVRVRTLP